MVELGSHRPVADAIVHARAEHGDDSGSARSDSQGRFRVTRLPPGRYRADASTNTGFGASRDSVRLGLGEVSPEVLVELHPAVLVTGRVDRDDAKPGSRGQVRLHDPLQDAWRDADVEPDGEVRVEGLLPGRYEVSVWCDDSVPADRYPEVDVAAAPIHGLRWRVGAGRVVRGVVVTADGAPLADIVVTAESAGGDPRGARSWPSGKTDSAGRFRIPGVNPGRYLLQPWTTDHAGPSEPVEVTVVEPRDTDGVRIVMERGETIEGTVVEAGGRPLGGVRVTADVRGWALEDPCTGDDGAFALTGLLPGSYRVVAFDEWTPLRAPGTGDDDRQGVDVVVARGQRARVRLVVERRDGHIRGRVLDAAGKPVTDAFLRAERESEATGVAAARAGRYAGAGRSNLPSRTRTGASRSTGSPPAATRYTRCARAAVRSSRSTSGWATRSRSRSPRTGVSRAWSQVRTALSLLGRQVTVKPGELVVLPDLRAARLRVADSDSAGGDLGFRLEQREMGADDPWEPTLEVALVQPDGPAASAGLLVGDRIVAVDGHDVRGDDAYLYPLIA